MSLLNLDLWNMDGKALVNFTEEDFKQRLPYGHGENLFAQFDVWRSNSYYDQSQSQSYGAPPVRSCSQESQASFVGPPPPYPDYSWPGENSGEAELGPGDQQYSDIAYMLQMLDNQNNPVGPPQPHYVTPKVEAELSSPPPYPGAGGSGESVASSDCGGQDNREEAEEGELVVLSSQFSVTRVTSPPQSPQPAPPPDLEWLPLAAGCWPGPGIHRQRKGRD